MPAPAKGHPVGRGGLCCTMCGAPYRDHGFDGTHPRPVSLHVMQANADLAENRLGRVHAKGDDDR